MYRLTVEKFVENEKYQEQVEAYEKRLNDFRYSNSTGIPEPQRYHLDRSLVVDVTDEEFSAVKKAVLGVV